MDNWQKDAPTLAAMPCKSPFSVPAGYFEELSAGLLSQTKIGTVQGGYSGHSVPQGYFNQLNDAIRSRIAAENLHHQIKSDGFTTPAGYFEQLQQTLIKKTEPERGRIRKLIPAWLNYAAAACVVFVIGAILIIGKQPQNGSVSTPQNLSVIPEQEIINYLQTHTDASDNRVIIDNLGKTDDLSQLNTEIPTRDLENYLTNDISL